MTQVFKIKLFVCLVSLRHTLLAPEITLPPVSVTNRTGSNVFLTCEAAGVPLPVVEWVYSSPAGKQTVYPSTNFVFLSKHHMFSSVYFQLTMIVFQH